MPDPLLPAALQGTGGGVTNGQFAGIPGHPIWQAAIDVVHRGWKQNPNQQGNSLAGGLAACSQLSGERPTWARRRCCLLCMLPRYRPPCWRWQPITPSAPPGSLSLGVAAPCVDTRPGSHCSRAFLAGSSLL